MTVAGWAEKGERVMRSPLVRPPERLSHRVLWVAPDEEAGLEGVRALGSPGSGLFGVLLLVVIAVFIAGLMVRRTPEHLGKKIGMREIKGAVIRALSLPCSCSSSPLSPARRR